MIKAICDDAPPTPGPEFSPLFHEFIAHCLQKDPDDRLTAQQLLQSTFIRLNIDPDSLTDSDKVKYNISSVSEGQDLSEESQTASQSNSVDFTAAEMAAKERSSSRDEKDVGFATLRSLHGVANIPRLDISASTPTRKGNQAATPENSPHSSTPSSRGNRVSHALTARSATAAALRKEFTSPNGIPIDLQRRNSKDSEVEILMQLLTGASSGEHSGRSSKETPDFSKLVESGLLNDGNSIDEGEEHELHIMNAIRLEHFDRVLEKIAAKLSAQRKNSMLNKQQLQQQSSGDKLSKNDFQEDTESDSNQEEDYNVNRYNYFEKNATADSMDDYGDLTVQSFSFGDDSLGEYNEVVLVNTNIDSEMDRLLMYGNSQPSESGSSSSSSSKQNKGRIPPAEEHALSQNPIELLRSTNAMSQHSILKAGSNFSMPHVNDSDSSKAVNSDQEDLAAVAAAIEQMHLQSASEGGDRKQQMPLKLSFSSSSKATSSRGGAEGLGPSSRSVHFMDPDQQNLSLRSNKDSFRSANPSSKLPPISGSGPTKAKNLKSLQLDLFEDDELLDGSASHSRDHHHHHHQSGSKTTRAINSNSNNSSSETISNFCVDSKTDTPVNISRKRSFSGNDFIEPQTASTQNPTSSGASSSSSGSSSSSSSKDRPSAINYREMLPKLDEKGLRKWRSLAEQLRLPFHLVKLAVKSRLGGMVELLDTDDLG